MKKCVVCSQEFLPTRNWQKYCSSKCRNHNPDKSEKTKKFQQGRRDKINKIKVDAGCAKCGYDAHPAALQFNHIIGEKKFNISHDPKRKWSDMLNEIAKCEILCANCHLIYSFENKHGWTKRKASK